MFSLFIFDLVKIYNSDDLNPDLSPKTLLNKVLFDMKYYLIWRGNENFHGMKKDFLQLMFDADTKIAYAKKVRDEMTKNHKECSKEIYTGLCPKSWILKVDSTAFVLYKVLKTTLQS